MRLTQIATDGEVDEIGDPDQAKVDIEDQRSVATVNRS
jgi:hypothetical protein